MKVFLSYAAFYNRAPFDALELSFEENEIAVLTAVNGRGKTTLLSHIVDALHEMARPFFPGGYEGKENKLYRISSQIEKLDIAKPSVCYLRFGTSTGEFIDYVNVRGPCSAADYEALTPLPNKIPFATLQASLEASNYAKGISSNVNQKKADEIFNTNVLTYFPSYRYEVPGYLNDPYQVELNFTKKSGFTGHLRNPIEVISGLPQLANWIMDVVLDVRSIPNPTTLAIFDALNKILTFTLTSKGYGPLRFGVGPRGFGVTRIQILEKNENARTIYPTIFHLSSGEAAVFCMFAEIARQFDRYGSDSPLENVTGLILVDEVDKHLHIRLQKEILPKLFALFPNAQFLLTSHSPFLSMGLADLLVDRARIVDLDTFGISTDPTKNELYEEVYRMMIGENEKFKTLYNSLQEVLKASQLPLVITEGKTDVQHLRSAKARRNIKDCDIEFQAVPGDWGDTKLKTLLEQLSKVPNTRKIIGIFDRDAPSIVSEVEADGQSYKTYGNNVFAFCLPTPAGRDAYTNISIEFLYKDIELKKERNGRRLYFDNEVEFRQSASKKSERRLIKLDEAKAFDENTKKIFDENIGELDWIHSKAVFADLIENDPDFSEDFDFSGFDPVFERIKEIIAIA